MTTASLPDGRTFRLKSMRKIVHGVEVAGYDVDSDTGERVNEFDHSVIFDSACGG